MKICILAGSRLEALRFAAAQGWDQKYWFCPSNEDALAGMYFTLILRLPGFFELPYSYWSRIEQMALTRVR